MNDDDRRRNGTDEPVPTIETESGERQLDPGAVEPAETAVETSEALENSVHEGPPSETSER